MPKKALTKQGVRNLKTDRTQEDFWDSSFRVRGISFGVRVSKTGSKEYIVRYYQHSKYRRLSIGDAGKLSLAEAHQKAITIAQQIEEGADPAETRDRYKSAETCAELFDLYLRQHASKKRDNGAEDERIINADLRKAIGFKRVCDVTRRDIIAILEHIASDRDAVVMSNRTRALLSKIFNFAVEREIVTSSPCVGLSAKPRERSRERVLNDEELKTLVAYLSVEGIVLGSLVKLILLTAARPGEVIGAQWDEIDLKEATWSLSPARTKNARAHTIPLSDSAIEMLKTLRIETGPSVFLFPSARSHFTKLRTVQNCIARAVKLGPIKHFTAHDLRRTAATGLRRLGTRREVVSKILNHTPQTVTAIYDRHQMFPEMQRALNRWGSLISDLMSNPDTNHLRRIKSVA